jgi:glutathione-specific gamma-glutamylcyclotransferase
VNDPAGLPPDLPVWGLLYEIDPLKEVEVKAYLDHREKDGYEEEKVQVWQLNEKGEEISIETEVSNFNLK